MYLIDRKEAVEAIKKAMESQQNDSLGLNIKYGMYLAIQELGKLKKHDGKGKEHVKRCIESDNK